MAVVHDLATTLALIKKTEEKVIDKNEALIVKKIDEMIVEAPPGTPAKKIKTIKGPKGQRGLRGHQGRTGKTVKGPQGASGRNSVIPGPQGIRGDIGPVGVIGGQGERGEKGDTPNIAALIDDFHQRFTKMQTQFQIQISKAITTIAVAAGGGGSAGGGSVNILDMDDVEFNYPSELANNDILVFNAATNKFTQLNITDVINTIRAELEVQFDKLVDEANSTVTYVGEREPGAGNTASAVWRIKQVDETTNPTTILWANGTANTEFIWDDRASLTYSEL